MPTTLAIIAHTFPDPARRARAIGVWAGSAGLAAAAGPVLGGALTTAIGWRSIFWINLPVGAVALALTGRYVEESRHPRPRRLDAGGQVLVAAAFALLAYALIEAPSCGWTSATTLGLFAASALTILGFLLVEARAADPLLDLRLLRNRSFSGATVIAVLLYLTLVGFLFPNTLYLQQVRGLSALAAGALMLPCSLALALGGPLGGRLVARSGPRPVLLAGSLFIAAAMARLARATPTTGFAVLGRRTCSPGRVGV